MGFEEFFLMGHSGQLQAGKEGPYASKQNLYKPKEQTNTGKQTVAFSASVLWDDIPVDLKNLNAFKFAKKLKHYLLSEQHSETLS